MLRKHAGFTLIELLVTLIVVSVIMMAVVTTFASMNTAQIDQDRLSEMEDNLRMGMNLMTDALRSAGYGVPDTNLNLWLPVAEGFTTAPVRLPNPATLKTAACVAGPQITISNPPAIPVGTTVLTLNSAANLAVGDLIALNNMTPALVKGKTATTITIDTNAVTTTVNDGVTRVYPNQTPICRVGISTFSVDTSIKRLMLNAGGTNQAVVQGITALNVTQSAGTTNRYQVTLTAQATLKNGTLVSRNLVSDVAVVN